ncbi:MAG: STAS domain-containing protein [Planctomycetota bacterium]
MPLQKWSDQIWLCQMSPEPTFSEEIDTLVGQFGKAEPKPHVVIDLSGLDVLNSSNLSQMLRVRKLVTDAGSKLRIAGPTNAVWSLFLTTGLDKVFDFAQDTMMALAELQISE